MALRSQRLSTGEWVVKDAQGRPVGTGFDNEREAEIWRENAEKREADKIARRRQAAR